MQYKAGGCVILRPKAVLLAFWIFICLGLSPVFARDVEITVLDSDLGFPLEGAVVRSADGKEFICNENGKTVIQVPDNRQVVIQAAYPGYETGRIVINTTDSSFKAALRLSGIMESRELVIEASRPGANETRTGRSVAISGKDIAQTGEIGIIEDVMSSVKLLPGVGYAGFFDAMPSIRGGDPGDMRASLDGFYVFNPYFWGGGFSIFDPRMVESAQMSHGVFSTRYGHSISGLLEITSKRPLPTETQFEIGVNTSAANASLSLPLFGKGGILFMGRVTYYDPVFAIAKRLSKYVPQIEMINSIRKAPYIRSGTLTGNFRFTEKLELKATGFWGMDGIGLNYQNSSRTETLNSDSIMDFDYVNHNAFFNSSLIWNPRSDMLLKFTAGAGFEKNSFDANMRTDILNKTFEKTPSNSWYYDYIGSMISPNYDFYTAMTANQTDRTVNAQGRIDYDWEPGKGFLVAAGVQEMYMQFTSKGNQMAGNEKYLYRFEEEQQQEIFREIGVAEPYMKPIQDFLKENMIVSSPVRYNPDAKNNLFTTSFYSLVEYNTPGNRIQTELGLRLDHYYLSGKGLSLSSAPVLNPRLNADFNILKGNGFFQSFDISVGTGLFSSMNNNIFLSEEQFNIKEIKPNRSLTSVLGAKVELKGGFIFNIEGYYKYIYDRMYIPIIVNIDSSVEPDPKFDGKGKAWGIDAILQKIQSRYFDGWVSYSYNWTKYRDPSAGSADMGYSGGTRGDDWYFPSYHRFHNLNLILNVRPVQNINIYTRFGLASGTQISKRTTDSPYSYPVYVYNGEGSPENKFIEMYYWPSVRDENNRTTLSLPLDIKVSILGKNKYKKTRYEVYVAVENVLALVYNPEGNTSFNRYTGQIDTGANSAIYEIPIPIPSFGFKISY